MNYVGHSVPQVVIIVNRLETIRVNDYAAEFLISDSTPYRNMTNFCLKLQDQ